MHQVDTKALLLLCQSETINMNLNLNKTRHTLLYFNTESSSAINLHGEFTFKCANKSSQARKYLHSKQKAQTAHSNLLFDLQQCHMKTIYDQFLPIKSSRSSSQYSMHFPCKSYSFAVFMALSVIVIIKQKTQNV